MYFSSLLTLLPFCHLDVDYVREFHRSFGLVHRAGWLPPLAGLAAAVAGWLAAAAGWAALAGWLDSALAGAGALAGHAIYEMHMFIYSKN
jgi:hypothetical protein